MRTFLAADIQLPPLQWQTILTLDLPIGIWDLLFSCETAVAFSGVADYVIEARLWDGESTFWGGGTVHQVTPIVESSPVTIGAHAAIAGSADLSAATVPTNLFAQLLYTPNTTSASAFAKARTPLNNLFAATWLIAQPDGGSGTLGPSDHQLLLDLHQALAGQSYAASAQHNGLTGSGTITVSWPDVALRVNVTAKPPDIVIDQGSPPYNFNLGFITVSNANGFLRSPRLVFDTQTYVLPAGAGQVGYTLRPGVTVDITVLQALT